MKKHRPLRVTTRFSSTLPALEVSAYTKVTDPAGNVVYYTYMFVQLLEVTGVKDPPVEPIEVVCG